MMHAKSIRGRITRLTIIAILVALIVAGSVAVFSIRYQEDVGSERFMSLLCETRSDHINERLMAVEQSVTTAADYIDESIDVVELAKGGVIGATGSGISLKDHDFDSASQREFDAYLARHIEDVRSVFFSIAEQNEGVLSYYYRINPEISQTEKGFLISRGAGGSYEPREPTDIAAYPSNDYVNVGWYYLPQEKGRPAWIDPYFDINQQVEVVSFIAPLYKADTFIGVVGMDISYESLVEQIEGLEVLTSGYAFLTDDHGEILYHPTLPRKMSLADVNSELEPDETSTSSSSLISYSFDGVDKKAAWMQLGNDMHLFVCAPTSEINSFSSWLLIMVLVISAIVVVALVFFVAQGTRRITKPLEDLTEAATQIADGNYDVNLTYDEDDEVGILTNSFRHLVDNVKVKIADLYTRAYKDALTSVRNKAAYDAYTAEIDHDLRRGKQRGFAVVAFDCNELKRINDTFGHDKGDVYLQNACRAICKVYAHSPVFRIGGDEFDCILVGDEYERRDELVHEFWDYVERESEAAGSDWEKISLAMGMAIYEPGQDRSVKDVARRADDLMYKNKHEFKAAHGILGDR